MSKDDAQSLPPAAPPQKRDPWGCMAGTVTILPGTDLTAPSDDKWNAEEGLLLNSRSPHGADDAR
ncbi:MAG: hypothetical protein ABSD08_17860 [Xanthobacteraceae bacterium]|jgi:hypothetical protein